MVSSVVVVGTVIVAPWTVSVTRIVFVTEEVAMLEDVDERRTIELSEIVWVFVDVCVACVIVVDDDPGRAIVLGVTRHEHAEVKAAGSWSRRWTGRCRRSCRGLGFALAHRPRCRGTDLLLVVPVLQLSSASTRRRVEANGLRGDEEGGSRYGGGRF